MSAPPFIHPHRPTSRWDGRLRSIPAAGSGSRTSGLAQRLVVLRCAFTVVQVAATGDIRRRRDPVVMLQLSGCSSASHRVAGSVERVIAAAVAEPVEAVRPPGGHLRVGGRINRAMSVTGIGSADKYDHQTQPVHVPVTKRGKLSQRRNIRP